MNAVDLSIIIVSYNSKDALLECLQSISENVQRLTYEIIVVDNYSTHPGKEDVLKSYPAVHWIGNQRNLGFSKANNQGIRIANGQHIVLLNNDTLVLPGAFEKMAEILNTRSNVGLVGGRLQDEDGKLQHSFGKRMNFINDFGRKVFTNLYVKHNNSWVGKYLEWTHSEARPVDWVQGACLYFRREALFEAGLLDENLFLYCEEMDISKRLHELGWAVYYTPEARIVHKGGVSTGPENYRALLEYRKSQLHFYKKHHGRIGLELLKLYLYLKTLKNLLCAGSMKEKKHWQDVWVELIRFH